MNSPRPSPELIVRHFYCDEAGMSDPAVEPYMVVAGIMLHVDNEYSDLQKYLLDMADDLVGPDRPANFVFHAKELWFGGKFFSREKWPLEKRLEILGRLADIPGKFRFPIIYACIERIKYPPKAPLEGSAARSFREAQAEANKKCHTICFLSCLTLVERWMEHAHKDEKVFVVTEMHERHKNNLLTITQIMSEPRVRPIIENDPNISWSPLTHIVDDPLFVNKSGSSPIHVADVCASILARSLNDKSHTTPLLEKILPNLVTGFRRDFMKPKASASQS